MYIPLILGQVPTNTTTGNEFRELTMSLSPEQQNFANSARYTQLESSVFGLVVIEIRPQLEVLLGLPEHSLTKEVHLTENSVSMFVDHQFPPDLLEYDGPMMGTKQEKIEAVKECVANAQEMVK